MQFAVLLGAGAGARYYGAEYVLVLVVVSGEAVGAVAVAREAFVVSQGGRYDPVGPPVVRQLVQVIAGRVWAEVVECAKDIYKKPVKW